MRKSILKVFFLLILLLITANFILPFVLRILKERTHPLLIDITCIESGNINDFYWKLNQVFISSMKVAQKESVEIRLAHSIPNFESYYIKRSGQENWEKLSGDVFLLPLPEEKSEFILIAKNMLGGQTKPFHYMLEVRDKNPIISPLMLVTTLDDVAFRFERYNAPGMKWLRDQTVPVVTSINGEWGKYCALRSWVMTSIPCGNPEEKSSLNPVEILKKVSGSEDVKFLCGEFAAVFVSSCISIGCNARMVHLRDADGQGHCATEVWSDNNQQWIFMDPFYDFHYLENGKCYSALDLHNLYSEQKYRGVQPGSNEFPVENYLDLFHDIQIVMSNDFLSNPLSSVWDNLSLNYRTLRWVDENTHSNNKTKLICKILLYYYFPKIGEIVITPYGGIPFCAIIVSFFFIMNVTILRRKKHTHKITQEMQE